MLRTAAQGQQPPVLHWSSKIYSHGLKEYGDSLQEAFDLDLRDPVVDSEHCFACGFMILGNWQV